MGYRSERGQLEARAGVLVEELEEEREHLVRVRVEVQELREQNTNALSQLLHRLYAEPELPEQPEPLPHVVDVDALRRRVELLEAWVDAARHQLADYTRERERLSRATGWLGKIAVVVLGVLIVLGRPVRPWLEWGWLSAIWLRRFLAHGTREAAYDPQERERMRTAPQRAVRDVTAGLLVVTMLLLLAWGVAELFPIPPH